MVDSVADELAVRNLVARLSRNADIGDIDTYMSSFAADAEWNMPGSPTRGADAIRAGLIERRATGAVGPGSNTRHMVSTVTVDIDGDTATSESYFQYLSDTTTNPTLRLVGFYRDIFVRTSDGWRLSKRDITFG
ncbi:MAG TPA: nuclear transport factor 2 family protein [Acidimicrobiia bacterium]|jgi:3-phenylpropionate/cinnamic acid dioxygenase small subunit